MAKKRKIFKGKLKGKIKSLKNKTPLKNAIDSKGFLVLLPYKPLMLKILAKKGFRVPASTSIKKVSLLFYSVVVRGNRNFEFKHLNRMSNYHHLEEGIDSESAKMIAQVASASAPSIIQGIIEWIKNVLAKKNRGEQLNENENIVIDEQEKVEKGEVEEIGVKKKKKGLLVRLWQSIFGGGEEDFRRRIDSRNVKPKTVSKKSVVYGTGANVSGMMSGSNVIQAYEYTQNYARSIKRLSESTGTLKPLVPNVYNTTSGTLASANPVIYGSNSPLSKQIYAEKKSGKGCPEGYWMDGRGRCWPIEKSGNYDCNCK